MIDPIKNLGFTTIAICVLLSGFWAESSLAQTAPATSVPQKSILQFKDEQFKGEIAPANQSNLDSQKDETAVDAGASIDNLLTELILENIPHHFEETKDWGGKEERWDGVKIRREGLKIKTKRRKKMVNHGTWKKYAVRLLNPNEEFSIQLKKMREVEPGKLAMDLHFTANLKIDGRQSKWVKGVQLYSFSVEGHSKVRLKISLDLEFGTDFTTLPPDMIFNPNVTSADLVVDEFRVDRISKAGGEFAQQVSKALRSQLDEKLTEKEEKLVEKINKQLTKKKDDLRISVAELMKSKWATAAKPFLSKVSTESKD